MKSVAISNLTRPLKRPVVARYCDSFFCRLRGLTFRQKLAPDEALLLVERRESRIDASIHMLAVFTDLAVVWINASDEVVDVRLARSWRPAYLPQKPARYTLEMPPARLSEFKIGDKIRFEQVWVD